MHYVQSPLAMLFIASWIDMFIDMLHTPLYSIQNDRNFHWPEKLNKRCIISSSGKRLNGTHEGKKTTTITTYNMFVLAYFIYFQRKKN